MSMCVFFSSDFCLICVAPIFQALTFQFYSNARKLFQCLHLVLLQAIEPSCEDLPKPQFIFVNDRIPITLSLSLPQQMFETNIALCIC